MQPAHLAQSVLVTGGAGFIGSHLVERLLDEGADVRVLDDLSTGSAENLAAVAGHPRLDLRCGSVLDEGQVAAALEGVGLVFHLAASVGVMRVARDPGRAIHTQVRGTELVLRHAARAGAGLLLASSSEVYGKGVKLPFSEEDDLLLGPPTQPRWSYACSKAAAECLAFAEPRVPALVARLFNTVGPRQLGDHGMVLPRLVGQGLRGEPLTVFGDGGQRRCFADVGEVVACLCRLARTPSAWGGVFNVGSDREVSIADLASWVRARTGGRSEIVRVPYEEVYGEGFEDLGRRVPDLRRLVAAIGMRPQRELADVLDDVVAAAAGALR
jgi:UDP-glucose 4-epimerase